MNILQILCIGIIAGIAGQIASPVGTTWGNYVLSRPLIAAFVIGLIVHDVPGLFIMCIPVQLSYLILVTPGGVVRTDIRTASYAGLAMAYGAVKMTGFAYAGAAAVFAAVLCGRLGTHLFRLETDMNERFAADALRDLDQGRTETMFRHTVLKPLLSRILVSGPLTALFIFAGIYVYAFLLGRVMAVPVLYRAAKAAGILIPLGSCARMVQAETEDFTWLLTVAAGLLLGYLGLPLWIVVITLIAVLFRQSEEHTETEEEEI